MTIIERALKKHRPGAEAALRKRPTRAPSLPIDPSLRLARSAVTLDLEQCRERRVILTAETSNDKAYIAAYRMLRTRLLHRARASNWTTIGITSAGPSEGKTLTAVNLALSLARDKTREVVLLDMDMRNPSVCRALGVRPQQELRAYLEHGNDLDGVFLSIHDNLLVGGSVSQTEHASELLSGANFDELLNTIRRGTRDPLVLIDLPPVLVTDDALVVAPKIDAVMVVAAQGLTDRTDLSRALNLLSEFPMAGVVLNRAAESTSDYRYGYEADSDVGATGKTI